jgi:hypothetical protein
MMGLYVTEVPEKDPDSGCSRYRKLQMYRIRSDVRTSVAFLCYFGTLISYITFNKTRSPLTHCSLLLLDNAKHETSLKQM